MQQINFTGNLERNDDVKTQMLFSLEEVKKKPWIFLQGTVKVL